MKPSLQQLHGSKRADSAQLFPKTPGYQDFACLLIRVSPRNPHQQSKRCLKLARSKDVVSLRLIPPRIHEEQADSERPWPFKAGKISIRPFAVEI